MTDLHYVYFSTKYGRNETRRLQVVSGPAEMHAALSNDKNIRIYIWCYDCDVEFFQNYFNKKVTVIGCQGYLETALENYQKLNDKYLIWLVERLLKVLISSENGLVRDTVFIKNTFSFFLLYSQGGYILDTNVFPYGEPNFKNFLNYKILNLIDVFNFQEIIHVIPNRKFFSKLCLAVTHFSDPLDYENIFSWQEFLSKLEILDNTYYKNYEEHDFQKKAVRLKVLDCWIQFSRAGDTMPLKSLEYCLRVWPLLCKERIADKNKKLSLKNFEHYSQLSYAIILSSIYDEMLHKKGFLARWFSFLHLAPKCKFEIPEKNLLHASFHHAKRLNRKDFLENEKQKRGGYLVKELNILRNSDDFENILEDGFQELNQDYIKTLNANNITGDMKQMEWWWQI